MHKYAGCTLKMDSFEPFKVTIIGFHEVIMIQLLVCSVTWQKIGKKEKRLLANVYFDERQLFWKLNSLGVEQS